MTLLSLCLVMIQAVTLPVLNHYTVQAEKKKIILQHADTIEGGEAAAGPYRSVIGNVVFLDGNMTLKCDRATEYERENKIVLQGNVFIADNTFDIYGESGLYFPEKEIGELGGKVKGRMLNNSFASKAERAVVNKSTSQIFLYGEAIAWHEQKQVSGDTIMLHLREGGKKGQKRSIDEMQVDGNAFFAAQDTLSLTPVVYDQLGGKKMVIRLNEMSKITGITVTGQAESLYHLYDEKRKPSGINYSSGNMIRMSFREGSMTKVAVTGNVEGKQFPERFRGKKEINLSKFAWREEENPFRKEKNLP
ncbi:MAG: LptA/OstA family protein [Chlorobium sp.]